MVITVHVFALVITALVAAPDGSVSVQTNVMPFADAAHCEAARIDLSAKVPDLVGAAILVCHDETLAVDPVKVEAAKAAAKAEDQPALKGI